MSNPCPTCLLALWVVACDGPGAGSATCEPTAEVPYDDVDQDCDGADLVDADQDGFLAAEVGGPDCDDADAATYPGAPEVWYDDADQDCGQDCDHDQDGDRVVADGAAIDDGGPCDADPEPGAVQTKRDCDDEDPAVSNRLLTQTPLPGAVDVHATDMIAVSFDAPEPGGSTLALTDPDGFAVPGTSEYVYGSVVFVPDAPLAAGRTYEATATWSCGTSTWSFTTRDVVGLTYAIDLRAGSWVQPPGIGPLWAQQLEAPVLFEVLDATATTIDARFATGDGFYVPASQDLCAPTSDVLAGDFTDDPAFAIGPASVTFDIDGERLSIDDATFRGTISDDLSTLSGGSWVGTMDTRGLLDLVGGTDPNAVCELVAAFGATCSACPGGGDYCLEVEIQALVGEEVGPLALTARTPADIAGDPTCP